MACTVVIAARPLARVRLAEAFALVRERSQADQATAPCGGCLTLSGQLTSSTSPSVPPGIMLRMTLTPTSQRNAVSEGVALGLALCDRTTLPHDKVRVDIAFTGAWRGWEYKSRFPQVSTDLSKNLDGIIAMTRAGEKNRTLVLFWDTHGPEITIYARQADLDLADPDEVEFALEVIGGDVPREGWVALAEAFLQRMDL